MMSKKLMVTGIFLFGIGTLSFSQLYATSAHKQKVKTDVVYSEANASVANVSKKPVFPTPDPELSEYYRNQVYEALQKYFDITLEDPNQSDVMIVNESFIEDYQSYLDQTTYNEYDPTVQTEEDLEEDLEFNKMSADGFRRNIERFNHDYALLDYIDKNFSFTSYFNENTKELIMLYTTSSITTNEQGGLQVSDLESSDETFNPKDFETLGTNFITQHQLGDIETPKLIASQVEELGSNIFYAYEDSTDSSKKVVIVVNPYTNKVCGFYTLSFAEDMFKTYFNLQS